MPRQPVWPPRIVRHKNGQARVNYAGKTYYLGPYGSQEARAAYARLLVELSTDQRIEAPKGGMTIGELITQYFSFLTTQPDSSTIRKLRNVGKAIARLFADVPVGQFSVRHLETLRSSWVHGRELHVSRNCVRRWIITGKLSGWRIGRKIFASWAEVQAFRKDIPKPGEL